MMVELTVPPRPVPTKAPFGGLLAAEWIKLRSLRSTYGVLGFGAFVMIAFVVMRSNNDVANWPEMPELAKRMFDPLHDVLNPLCVGLLTIVAGSLGALSVVGEYANGMIRTTFIAVPDRSRVVAAKLVVLVLATLVAGALIIAISFGVADGILAGIQQNVSPFQPGVFRALLATVLLVPVSAVIGMGIGAVTRHVAFAVVAVCAVLLIVPASLTLTVHIWLDDIRNSFPYNAWDRLIDQRSFAPSVPVFSIAGSWVVYVAWAVAAVATTGILVRRRDV